MVPQSIGTGNRCIVNCLGEHGSLCLSTNLSGSKSTSTHEEISVPDNFDSYPVATEKLVHRSPSNVNGLPKETASKARSVVLGQGQNIYPNPQLFNLTAWLLSTDHSRIRDFGRL